MRIIVSLLLAVLIGAFATINSFAQRKTIILVRHAEKDVSESADKNDPVLSGEGVQRAERLRKLISKYRPGAVYSSDYKRTRATVEPIAKKRRVEIQTYDPKNNAELIDRIMKSKTKRFIVAGHSNTIPGLANQITKKELFKNLDDAEYGTIWVIRMKDGRVRKTEILPY
ncbi:MAG: phosphoglycerate mutase family protein [Acidobacteriota bacterium]